MSSWTIYFAGLLSFMSPCVLPIIPIYFAILLQDEECNVNEKSIIYECWRSLLPKGLLFCLGFSIIFSVLGLGAGRISSLIASHRGSISLFAGIIILVFGLKLLNLIHVPFFDKSYSININKFKTRFGFLNSFIFGLLFAATWSPCIGPVLGGILTYLSAKEMTPMGGAIKLLLFSAGLSTPLILSIFFFRPLMKFAKNNKYFIVLIQKVLGVVLIIFAFNLFGEVAMLADRTAGPSAADKIVQPDKLPIFISMISADCETCNDMLPVIKKLKDNCDGAVIDFRTIDVANPEYSYAIYRLGMIGTPTYILMDVSGKETHRFIGYQDIKDLDAAILKTTGKKCLKD
ncbi:MAG: cytochrome c biogenesis protein CcdA [bacterium]